MKKRSYKLSLPRWALAQRESWYAELAARGLRVQKAGAMLTRFAPAPPARLRYRFEVGSDEGGLPAGQKEFYEECGWQYVLNDRPLHLFCAPEQTDAPDLHTDPAALAESGLSGAAIDEAMQSFGAAAQIAQQTGAAELLREGAASFSESIIITSFAGGVVLLAVSIVVWKLIPRDLDIAESGH